MNDTAVAKTTLTVSPDGLRVLLSAYVPGDQLDTAVTQIASRLQTMKIKHVPSPEALELMLREVLAGRDHIDDLAIVVGKAPKPPRHGRLEWAADFFTLAFEHDEGLDRLDYRKQIDRRFVEAGALLVTVVPPEEGVDGVDVRGAPIKAEAARPAALHAGSGVRFDESSGAVHATVQGRVQWVEPTVSVDEIYHVSGNVNLKTGDIDYPGAIVVSENIEAGTHVKSTGDIEVFGGVEGCDIECGGDLIVHGGITGGERKLIRAEGTIHSRFIDDAYVEAGGDIHVEREIVLSDIKTLGAVHVSGGQITGGCVVAREGIEAGLVGSASGTRTQLVTAVDYRLQADVESLRGKLEEHKRSARYIHERIDPLRSREATLAPKQKEVLTELLAQADMMETRAAQFEEEIEQRRRDAQLRGKPVIRILQRVYSEVTLGIRNERLPVKDLVYGPVTAMLGDEGHVVLKMGGTRGPL